MTSARASGENSVTGIDHNAASPESEQGGPLPVIHRDASLIVVHKPSGLAVHRGWARDRHYALTRVRDQVGMHVYPIHRLDRATSGLLMFALQRSEVTHFQQLFNEQRITKRYLALVRGQAPLSGLIDHPIRKAPKNKDRIDARTRFWRRGCFGRYSLVEALPLTGRLHQIRMHLRHLNHPIIGDTTLGDSEHNRLFRDHYGLYRMALHAWRMAFVHPLSQQPLALEAALPDDLLIPLVHLGLWPVPERCDGSQESGEDHTPTGSR